MNEEPEEFDEEPTMPSTNYYRHGQDLTFTPTTREEERELFKRAKAGDEDARTFLITNHLLFAKLEAQRMGAGAEEDELTSAANLALMTAVDQFDLKFKSRFTSYLRPFIWGEVARLWRDKNIVGSPRHIIPPKTVYLEDFDVGHDNHGMEGDIAVRLLQANPMEIETVLENFNFETIDNRTTLKIIWDIAKQKLTKYEFSIFTAVYRNGETLSEFAKKRGVSRNAIHLARKRSIEKITRELRRRRLLK